MTQRKKQENTSKKKASSALTETNENLPAFMQNHEESGKENISNDDMVIPRVALMQAVNSEVMEGNAESGNFFHTVNEVDLGKCIRVVVLHYSKRYILWNPRHAGGGILARASDGVNWDQPDQEFEIAPYKDRPKYTVKLQTGKRVGRDLGLGKWGTMDPENPDSPPAATLTHAFVCIDPDNPRMGPFIMLLQRSAEPVAKMLLTKINLDPAPMFGQMYEVTSKVQSNASGDDFNQYVFTKDGHISTEEFFETCSKLNKQFTESGVKYDENAEQPEDVESDDEDGNSPGY